MNVIAIMGLCYGCEGKGEAVDSLLSSVLTDTVDAAVVLYNEGAQRRHFVPASTNRPAHTFRHFGSGALYGVPTILGKRFVCCPVIFVDEMMKLTAMQQEVPTVFVHPECYITTHYEILLNRNMKRRSGRSSAGVGYGNTIRRENIYNVSFKYKHLIEGSASEINSKLEESKEHAMKIADIFGIDRTLIDVPLPIVYSSIVQFKYQTKILKDCNVQERDLLILEGGKGMLNGGGLRFAVEFAEEYGLQVKDATYITRPYLALYGDTVIEHELSPSRYGFVEIDPDPFLKAMRFGALNINTIKRVLENEVKIYKVPSSIIFSHKEDVGREYNLLPIIKDCAVEYVKLPQIERELLRIIK